MPLSMVRHSMMHFGRFLTSTSRFSWLRWAGVVPRSQRRSQMRQRERQGNLRPRSSVSGNSKALHGESQQKYARDKSWRENEILKIPSTSESVNDKQRNVRERSGSIKSSRLRRYEVSARVFDALVVSQFLIFPDFKKGCFLVRDQGVGGSNPLSPTILNQ